ncbi:acetyl-CoA acetyltransferase domain protein [Mycobacterium xenopi 4042]|uniref:Acetyl-CoA acetyltransferase domain protein n=1 Tax=Mycobacterium xenopi 4042 TaxID=1299334 RepID=X7ZY90_MYCXE|nr:acetyl-CoA acetyltransferase domain protein [Mycobacterium xenopi 4042]
MPEAYIIDAVRTAVGKRNGPLAGVHPIDLGRRLFTACSGASTSTPALWTT